jgi:hypothetical protein
MGETELSAQSIFYNATKDECACGMTLHYSRMFDQKVPCPHQIHGGAAIPKWKIEAKLVYEKVRAPVEIHMTIFPRTTKLEDRARAEWLKTLAIDNIKHFSRTKQQKRAIQSWVGENWPTNIGDHFALGIPMTVLSLIAHGVNEFAARRKRSIEQHDPKGTDETKENTDEVMKAGEEMKELGEKAGKDGEME